MISAPGERNNGGVDLPSANSQRDQNLIKKFYSIDAGHTKFELIIYQTFLIKDGIDSIDDRLRMNFTRITLKCSRILKDCHFDSWHLVH